MPSMSNPLLPKSTPSTSMSATSATPSNVSSRRQILVTLILCSWFLFFFYGRGLQDAMSSSRSGGRFRNPSPAYIAQMVHSAPSGDGGAQAKETIPKESGNISKENANTALVKDARATPTAPAAPAAPTSPPKQILLFTDYFDVKEYEFGFGQQPFVDYGCPVTNCYLTNDKKHLGSLADFDALVFHMRNMQQGLLPLPNQKKRKPNQRYVMFLMESPVHDDFPYSRFKDFFNWTMTYRLDSDLPRPYGWVDVKGGPWRYQPVLGEDRQWRKFDMEEFKKKLQQNRAFYKKTYLNQERTGMVAWVVSNCHTTSQREMYVKQLQSHVPVHIMGNCGADRCNTRYQGNTKDNCSARVDQEFKFYLSFENSLCDQYTTEKFWRRLSQNVIPIVLGQNDYSQLAPPHSYIDVRDFESPGHLAEYLKFLDKNETAYLSYFWWKEYYWVREDRAARAPTFCKLCAMLNSDLPPKTYHDLTDWWKTGGHCKKAGQYPWSRPEKWKVGQLIDEAMAKMFGTSVLR